MNKVCDRAELLGGAGSGQGSRAGALCGRGAGRLAQPTPGLAWGRGRGLARSRGKGRQGPWIRCWGLGVCQRGGVRVNCRCAPGPAPRPPAGAPGARCRGSAGCSWRPALDRAAGLEGCLGLVRGCDPAPRSRSTGVIRHAARTPGSCSCTGPR